MTDSRRAQEKILDHYNGTSQKSHKMLRCPAKLQSVVAKFSGQIFTKIKFLILFSLRSFLLPLHSFFLKFPLNFQCRDKSSCTWGWFQNGLVISKTSTVLEHFGTNYLDIVVLLTRAQIWKTSSIQWKVSHNLAAPSSAFLRVEGSLTILILVWPLSQHIILWKSEGLNCLLWKGNSSFSGVEIFGVMIS